MGGVIRFTVPVKCGGKEYSDNGILLLPNSYDGSNKIRLVISCHGAGGSVRTDDSQSEGQVLTKYLLSNGYAVMDVNGLPEKYAEINGIDIKNNIGSPIAVDSYVNAYRFCVSNFNFYAGVFVHGASMGGISSTNLVLSRRIPVVAQSGFCPVLDAYRQIFLHPWSGGLPKTAMGKIYDLEVDGYGEYVYDRVKISPFNPMAQCDRQNFAYPVPVKFWHCEDDPVVDIAVTKRFIENIAGAGGIAELETFKNGAHEPQLVGPIISDPEGISEFSGKKLQITPAVEGVYLWIKRFDGMMR